MSVELPAAVIAANADPSMEVVRAYIGARVRHWRCWRAGRPRRHRRPHGNRLPLVSRQTDTPEPEEERQEPGRVTILAAALAVAVFAVAMKLSGLYPAVLDAASMARRAASVIADSTLDDLEKEKLVQRHALLLLGRSLLITLRAAAVFGSPILLLAAMHWLGLAKFEDVTALLLGWEAITVTTVVFLGAWAVWLVYRRWRPARDPRP